MKLLQHPRYDQIDVLSRSVQPTLIFRIWYYGNPYLYGVLRRVTVICFVSPNTVMFGLTLKNNKKDYPPHSYSLGQFYEEST